MKLWAAATTYTTGAYTKPEDKISDSPALFEDAQENQPRLDTISISDIPSWKLGSPAREQSKGKIDIPKDNSRQLTMRLVSARGQFEVRKIMAETSSGIAGMRMAASISKDKDDKAAAFSAIRRLERLLVRGGRKIRDLDGEDILRAQKRSAERKRQEKRAEEIKKELRKKETGRRTEERGYLLDKTGGTPYGNSPFIWPNAAAGAGIAYQAAMLAAAEVAAQYASCADAVGGGADIAAGVEGSASAGPSIDVTA